MDSMTEKRSGNDRLKAAWDALLAEEASRQRISLPEAKKLVDRRELIASDDRQLSKDELRSLIRDTLEFKLAVQWRMGERRYRDVN